MTTTALPLPRLDSLWRRISIWRVIFYAIMAAALYAAYLRAFHGLGSVSNLSDEFPWGIWIGFDVLCGVGLAAGGFTLVAIVHIFHIKRYQPILRPAILTAFLGYLLVVVALMFDLGRPDRIWHPLVMWNPRSVMFEVAWCVMLYNTVLALEFAPVVFERMQWRRPMRIIQFISPPLVIAGVILSTLHQSSLGSLYLIVPSKLHPLWYSPLLPLLFYISAISVGLAMTIFESWHSSRAFGKQLEWPLLMGLGRLLAVVLGVFLVMRLMDLSRRHALVLALEPRPEVYLFYIEMFLMAAPVLVLLSGAVATRPRLLYLCSVSSILGFIANRLNVSVTGIQAVTGASYVPRWTEIAITMGLIAAGFAIFRLAAKHLPLFEHAPAGNGREST
ncbi:MAG: Ni/Fe-hydrogenase cytochrome b subunit [Bryobacterales bacterium]|nr:Ni/Fe-hydrogenase cytochrome b subunit [Bryobacterales bacterium]